MKYNINIYQLAFQNFFPELDIIDAAIVKFVADFANTGKMETIWKDGKPYYWVKYDNVIKQMPILKIRTNEVIGRRLRNISKYGLLHPHPDNKVMRRSYYCFGERYSLLVCEPDEIIKTKAKQPKQVLTNSKVVDDQLKSCSQDQPKSSSSDQLKSCSYTNSNIDTIINENKIKKEKKKIKNFPPPPPDPKIEISKEVTVIEEVTEKEKSCAKKEKPDYPIPICTEIDEDVWESKEVTKKEKTPSQLVEDMALDAIEAIRHLNRMTGFNFSYSTQPTTAAKSYVSHAYGLLVAGYTLEQIKLMIDFKCFQWAGTKMAANLNPKTLFKNHGPTYIEEAEQAKNNPAFRKAVQAGRAKDMPTVAQDFPVTPWGLPLVERHQIPPKHGAFMWADDYRESLEEDS